MARTRVDALCDAFLCASGPPSGVEHHAVPVPPHRSCASRVHLSLSRPVGACTSLPAPTCRRASTQSRKGPPSVSRQASIASPARSRPGSKFPTLDLRAGAVIDGQNGGFIGIDGPDAPADQPGTIILGGVFQHFGNASSPIWVTPMIVRRNGVVDGTEFRDNFNSRSHGAGRQRPRGPCVHPSQRSVRAERHACPASVALGRRA